MGSLACAPVPWCRVTVNARVFVFVSSRACRFVFVLRPGAAASTLPPSPETPIPWPCVERLILPTPLPHKWAISVPGSPCVGGRSLLPLPPLPPCRLECPICLDVPNAPRITACGHVMWCGPPAAHIAFAMPLSPPLPLPLLQLPVRVPPAAAWWRCRQVSRVLQGSVCARAAAGECVRHRHTQHHRPACRRV